jgi:hypothetical protein
LTKALPNYKMRDMVKRIRSKTDVKKLTVGDILLDHEDAAQAKTYIVENVSDGIVYAVNEAGYRSLKLLLTGWPLSEEWWLVLTDKNEENPFLIE